MIARLIQFIIARAGAIAIASVPLPRALSFALHQSSDSRIAHTLPGVNGTAKKARPPNRLRALDTDVLPSTNEHFHGPRPFLGA